MSFGRVCRAFALTLLGAMLLVRMGPMCEAKARAAHPLAETHAVMAGCDHAPSTPAKKTPPDACVGTCIATPLEVHSSPAMQLATRVALPVPEHQTLHGRSSGPAPPPPRTA